MAITNPQQLNLADRIAVRRNIVDRCVAVVANKALYWLGLGSATAQQTAWAKNAIQNTATQGEAVSWYVLNQTSFLNGGSAIEDAELTGIVEAAIDNHFVDPVP